MCGIVGYLGSECIYCKLMEGLRLLQNRGYDSAGIMTSVNPLLKYASSDTLSALDKLDLQEHKHSQCMAGGIGHTRWATHGSKTDANAHPHSCQSLDRSVYVVHNGIIDNYQELRKKLPPTLLSETDTEVIAVQFAENLKKYETTFEAWKQTINVLEGSWAIAATVSSEPHSLYLSKNGSPLLVGYNSHSVYVASESLAFQKYTSKWLLIKDGETLCVKHENNQFWIQDTTQTVAIDNFVPHGIHTTQQVNINVSPDPYLYWTEKEIYDQSHTLWDVLNRGGRIQTRGGGIDATHLNRNKVKLGGLDCHSETLLGLDHLILLGCGTSLHAGLFACNMLRKIGKFNTVQVFDASEFQKEDLPQRGSVGIVVISQSGETKDCHRVMLELRQEDVVDIMIGVVNVVGSLIARETDCGIYLNAGREVGVASTKSFTSQVVALLLLALWFSQNRNHKIQVRKELIHELQLLPTHFKRHQEGMRKSVVELLDRVVTSKSMFILGRHYAHSIALEGALKIKELTYKNIEGYVGGGLKHGPFALIEQNTPIFLHIYKDTFKDRMVSCISEVKSRGAYVVVITNDPLVVKSDLIDYVVFIDVENVMFATLLSIQWFQFLALELSCRLGNHPDYPRNLAKVVTVDG